MRTPIIIFIIAFFTFNAFSQEDMLTKKELKKIAKEEKQDRMLAESKEKRELTSIMLENHRFVLEATYLSGGTGERIPVNSTINFIAIDSLNATMQLGSSYGIGRNGLGGITLEGSVTKYELKKSVRKNNTSYYLVVLVSTTIGTYDISFSISESGNTDATIRGMRAGYVKYSGKLVPIGVSRIYKGSAF